MNLPQEVKRNGLGGKVYVEFLVREDGSVDDETVRLVSQEELMALQMALDATFDSARGKEAVRIVRASPNWIPGSNKGINVSQRVILPIMMK